MRKKNGKKGRQQQQRANSQQAQPQVNSVQAVQAPQEVEKAEPVTIDDLVASTSQAEFESQKDKLIQQVLDEITAWDDTKNAAEKAAEEAKLTLAEHEKKKGELTSQRDELQAQVNELQ